MVYQHVDMMAADFEMASWMVHFAAAYTGCFRNRLIVRVHIYYAYYSLDWKFVPDTHSVADADRIVEWFVIAVFLDDNTVVVGS